MLLRLDVLARSSMLLAIAAVGLGGESGCSMPPAGNAELLRERPPQTVTITGRLTPGAQATFGDTSALVESAMPASGGLDLTRASVGSALALVAATATDIEAVRRDLDAASEVARSHHRGPFEPFRVNAEGTASERVHRQAGAVAHGKATLAAGADVAAMGLRLAGFLGAILADPEQPLVLSIGADSHGVPYRATCTTKTGETLVEDPRRSLSCVIVRADVVPTSTWHLSIESVRSGTPGEIVPQARGWLRREPMIAGDDFIWVSRPDTTTPRMRWSEASLSSFVFMKGSVALAGLQLDCAGQDPKAWLARADEGGEQWQALEVAMAVLALTPWPVVDLRATTDDSPSR